MNSSRTGTRRRAGWIVASAVVILTASSCGENAPPAPPQQNLLLVTFDTTRTDALGCYGGDVAVTPTIDALARGGVLFETAYAPVAFTLPTHTTLMSGLQPYTHGIRTNGLYRVPSSVLTLAEHLGDLGLQTAAFPSASVLYASEGLEQGFDDYVDDLGEGAGLAVPARPAERTTELFLEWLGEHADDPFFVWLHYFDPHTPREAPADLEGRFGSVYLAEVHHADRNLGRVLDALRQREILDRTLVCITADHGEGLGDHGEAAHGAFLYECTMRVPLIFHQAGLEPQRIAGPVSLVDVAPTLLELLGAPPLPEIDGTSLVPMFSGASNSRSVYLEGYTNYVSFGWSPLEGLIAEGFKYIAAPRPELYDLANDPREITNLADTDKERATRLREELAALRAAARTLPPELATVDAEAARNLEALGYAAPGSSEVVTQAWPAPGPDAGADPKDRVHVLPMLYTLFNAGAADQTGRVIQLSRLILQEDPGSPIALQYLGGHLVRAGRFSEALPYLERLEEKGRLNLQSSISLGMARVQSGDPQGARRALDRALGFKADDEVALFWLADAEAKLGNNVRALSLLRRLREGIDGPQEKVELVEKLIRELAEAEAKTGDDSPSP